MDWLLITKIAATVLAFLAALGVMLGLPTTLLAWLGLLLVALVSKFQAVSGWALLATFFGCLIIEFADNLLASFMVQRFGASKGSVWMALLGGLVGGMLGGLGGGLLGGFTAFFISPLLALVGAFVGGYAAVYRWERKRNRPEKEATRAAWGTVIGRLLGIALKVGWIGALLIFVLGR